MAILHVEYGRVSRGGHELGTSVHGKCLFSESITLPDTSTAVTTAQAAEGGNSAFGSLALRLTADTDCYFAVGFSPDEEAVEATGATSARRFLAAGATYEGEIFVGESVAAAEPS